MAFKVKTASSFTWPVKFSLPGADGARTACEFSAQFKLLPQSEIDALLKANPPIEDNELAARYMTGWSGVVDEDDAMLAFTPENLAVLLDVAGMRRAIAAAFFEAMLGEARRGN